uniref:BombyxinA-2 n=1 Tax=Bombyx mori TaxID=7091 RepID=E9N025_BOMMO|nr:bombyxinA-2 [Bombyx mori]
MGGRIHVVMSLSLHSYYRESSITKECINDFEDVDLHGDWPWTGRRGALSADWTRYKRQGIVNECCFKPCTTDVLLKYC